jgi:tellurite methyltransferase
MENFSERARTYYDKRWKTEAPRESPSDVITQAIREIPPVETLDLGAGDGRNAVFLARNGFPVTAVDFSEEGARVIKERATKERLPIRAEVADIRHWAPERRYPLIVCTHLLHLLKDANARVVLKRIQDATEPGGWNVMDAWISEGDQFKLNATHGNFYLARGELPTLYEGWGVLSYDEVNTDLFKKLPNGRPLQNTTARLIARKPGAIIPSE